MVEVVPLFLSYVVKDANAHICIGVRPKTLCGSERIQSATQVDDVDELVEKLEDVNVCSECDELFDRIRDEVRSEPTITCHRCGHTYSSQLARSIKHIDDGSIEVCRPCYIEILEDPDSGVETPYGEAEPFYETSGDRQFDED